MKAEFYRYAICVVVGSLAVIAVGAYVTSLAIAPQLASRGSIDASVHRSVAMVVLVLTLFLALWQTQSHEAPFLGWTAMAALLIEAWLGWSGDALLHATVAPVTFAILLATALAASSGWNEPVQAVEDRGGPTLRRMVTFTPPLVLLQILLGATYRHKLTGVLPHLGLAMIVSLVSLTAAMLVLRQFPEHRLLRSAAAWLMAALIAQVTLGIAALALQLLNLGNSTILIVSTALHVVVGSLTLAASVALAMAFQRYVRRAIPA